MDQLKSDELSQKTKETIFKTAVARDVMPFISVKTDGLTFLFDSRDTLMANSMITLESTYSRDEIDFCLNFLKDTEIWNDKRRNTFLDIGANIGTTSIYARKQLKNREGNKIIAFEPVPPIFRLLRANCILNGYDDIVCENYAVSSKKGNLKFNLQDGNFGGSNAIGENDETIETYEVRAITLDEYAGSANLTPESIFFVWIDVEGFEPDVIEGGKKIIRSAGVPIYIEYNPSIYKRRGVFENAVESWKNLFSYFIVPTFMNNEKMQNGIFEIGQLELYTETIDFRDTMNIMLLTDEALKNVKNS